MLNVERVRQEINVHDHLVVSFDVSKDWLDGLATHRIGSAQYQEIEIRLRNRTQAIEQKLHELAGYAEDENLEGLWVICEPTGGYERKLLKMARRLGHRTAYANSEHVAKMSVIESGDTNKTDRSDARVISLVAQVNRTQKDRQLTGEYALLRELGKMYDQADDRAVQLRCRLNDRIREMFCDYQKRAGYLYETTGQAIMAEYCWNPYRIVEDGFEAFRRRIKNRVRGVREKTFDELWVQAQSSARQAAPDAYTQMLEERIRQLWSDYWNHQDRKDQFTRNIEALYQKLEQRGEVVPPVEELSRKQLGRLIGETGPLDDFTCWRQLLDYAGLKLRERESGRYKGEIKVTKKGRPRMRKVLGQMAYTLSQKNRLFADYYRQKKQDMNAIKARVAVMRKIVKFLFGLWQSDRPYDPARVFTCKSQYAGTSGPS